MVERVGTTNTRQYLHRDHQGSVTKVTDASGTLSQALAFDAWGLRRDASDWSALGSPFAGSHETERGYTGHEHLDAVGLIHMNGRVQDPMLGRFISADPLIQSPYSTQSHNRYSYVWNNPVSMTDPSGFEGEPANECPVDDCMRVIGVRNNPWAWYDDWLAEIRGTSDAEDWALMAFYGVGSSGASLPEQVGNGPMPSQEDAERIFNDVRTRMVEDLKEGTLLVATPLLEDGLPESFIDRIEFRLVEDLRRGDRSDGQRLLGRATPNWDNVNRNPVIEISYRALADLRVAYDTFGHEIRHLTSDNYRLDSRDPDGDGPLQSAQEIDAENWGLSIGRFYCDVQKVCGN